MAALRNTLLELKVYVILSIAVQRTNELILLLLIALDLRASL